MTRIINLTEQDIKRIVKRVLKEDIEILADEKICMEFGKIKELM